MSEFEVCENHPAWGAADALRRNRRCKNPLRHRGRGWRARPGVFQFARHELFHVGSASAGIAENIPDSAVRHGGHGQSAVLPGPYTIEQLGNDFLGLLDELHLGPVHFCGLSMGGMIGMWLGIHAPSRLNKLVLCNTGAKIGARETWNSRIETVQKSGMKSIATGVMERWFTPAFRAKAPATVAQIQKMLEETNPDGCAACCAAVRDYDCRGQLERIGAQTLIITGAHDPATPAADGRFIAAHIRGAKYAELDAAHLSNIGDAARFTRELTAFLNS